MGWLELFLATHGGAWRPWRCARGLMMCDIANGGAWYVKIE